MWLLCYWFRRTSLVFSEVNLPSEIAATKLHPSALISVTLRLYVTTLLCFHSFITEIFWFCIQTSLGWLRLSC